MAPQRRRRPALLRANARSGALRDTTALVLTAAELTSIRGLVEWLERRQGLSANGHGGTSRLGRMGERLVVIVQL